MDISSLSINNIQTNNQLIKGRLHLLLVEIKKLYRLQLQQNQRIHKELSNKDKILKASLDQIKKLKSELKYSEETLQKAFQPTTENIALLYKNIGNNYYIKARFYWQGKQREVQVGSIPNVLNVIQKMLSHGYLKNISMPKSCNMTWMQFKNKANLIEATKEIAALKFQEYIIRKLLAEYKDQIGKDDLDARNNEKPEKTYPDEKNDDEYNEGEKNDWYVQWRKDNL